MKEIKKLVRKNVLQLAPYSSARHEFTGQASVFLDANENPFGEKINRYPDPNQTALKRRLSALKNVAIDQIFVGNGSDEAIDLIYRAFAEPRKDRALIFPPTYGMYAVSAHVNDIEVIEIPLTKDYDLQLDKIKKLPKKRLKLAFICRPNNPTGTMISWKQIKKFYEQFDGMLVIDEAYIDFIAEETILKHLKKYPRIIVLQTLSKAWGLAGIRLGLAFGHPYTIALLNKIKPPYNVNILTQSVALDALDNVALRDEHVLLLKNEREKLRHALKSLTFVEKVIESQANFLLVKMKNSKAIFNQLKDKGIVVRDRSNVILCEDCLRFTIGTPEENTILLNALKEMSND